MKSDNSYKREKKKWRKLGRIHKNSADGILLPATGHQQGCSLQNVLYVPPDISQVVHILLVELLDGGNHIPPNGRTLMWLATWKWYTPTSTTPA